MPGLRPRSPRRRRFLVPCALACLLAPLASAVPLVPGDLDANGHASVRDAVLLVRHLNGDEILPSDRTHLGDADQDGFVADPDVEFEVAVVLGFAFAPTTMTTSPRAGDKDVSVTRETILRFNRPLAADANPAVAISAHFGDEVLAARMQISPSRDRVTLFYEDPLPASSRIRVDIDGDLLLDVYGGAVDVDGNAMAGGQSALEFDTATLTSIPGTAFVGRVFASQLGDGGTNSPLEGVTITVDAAPQYHATTDSNGDYSLSPCPAGAFYVHVDGRTVTNPPPPPGAYYPFVGKKWVSVPGAQMTMDNIYLPLMPAGTLQPVSETDDTTIHFPASVLQDHPEFADVKITVPAGSLYFDDGSPGEMTGIGPVAPDRLPGTLPPGLGFPVVLTVQTNGATNFNVPAPVCFPNLPDPVTHETLPAGAKTALWDFNHDTGTFDIVGPATVSDDGTITCTDPGVGILAPGWHGVSPSTPSGPRPGPRPPPPRRRPEDPPPPDSSDNNCRGLNGQEIGDTLGDFIVTIGRCLAEFADVSAQFRKILNIIDKVRTMFNDAIALVDTLSDPMSNRASIARDVLKGINDIKGVVLALQAEVVENSPFVRARAILNCLESVLGFADNVCGRVNGACSSVGLRATCFGISTIKNVVSTINVFLDKAEAGMRDFAMAASCALIDQIAAKLNFESQQPPDGVSLPDLADDDPVPPDVISDFMAFASETNRLALGLAETEQAAMAEVTLPDGQTMAQQGINEYNQEPAGYPSISWWHIHVRNLDHRGLTNDDGDFLVNLPPSSSYTIDVYDPHENVLAHAEGMTSPPGYATALSKLEVIPIPPLDTEGDGLPDAIEDVVGSDIHLADTDEDDLSDFFEVHQGTDPADRTNTRRGIIGTADTPGIAVDVAASSDVIVIADSSEGVSIFNAFSGLAPTLLARVPTPSPVQRVTVAGGVIAAVLQSGQVSFIDFTDPTRARITRTLSFGAQAKSAFARGRQIFVGLFDGTVVAVDPFTVSETDRIRIPGTMDGGAGRVDDLASQANTLFAITPEGLDAISCGQGPLTLVGHLDMNLPSPNNGFRLLVGGGIAYVTGLTGYATVDVSDPTQPTLIQSNGTGQIGWRQIVVDGSGSGFAAVDANGGGPQDVSRYDVSNPQVNNAFEEDFSTPGEATAVTICNGLGYVADGGAGLEVVRFVPGDIVHQPPSITLSADFQFASGIESGQPGLLLADAVDDVQVRNVEFYVDGVLVGRDGAFPFEMPFVAPPRTPSKTSFTVHAIAFDTAGGSTATTPVVVSLVPDVTRPTVVSVRPANNASVGSLRVSIAASFSELIDVDTLFTGFTVAFQGPDAVLGTADDVPVVGAIAFNAASRSASFTPNDALQVGRFRATLSTAVADSSGNTLLSPMSWEFSSSPGVDSDADGLPDDVEDTIGTDPQNPDSDGDGQTDGFEDADGDTLDNRTEFLDGTDPLLPDTDADGVTDDVEITRGCRPTVADLTIARGGVTLNGQPIDGVQVSFPESPGVMGTTTAGHYEIPGVRACLPAGLSVKLDFTSGGKIYRRLSAPLQPVIDGLTVFATLALQRLDTDQDGVPDDAEASLGLDPGNPDSDFDGTSDGDEDPDAEGLKNRLELVIGTNPLDPDSDDDGVSDKVEFDTGCDPLGPDLTNITGRVLLAGVPVSGATVRIGGHPSTTTNASGVFTYTNVRQCGPVIARITKASGAQNLGGASDSTEPVPGGTTSLGDITVVVLPKGSPWPMQRFVLANPGIARDMRPGDLNRDGALDVVVSVDGSPGSDIDTIQVLLGDGAGGFLPAVGYVVATGSQAGPGPESTRLVDLDGDGDLDIATIINGEDAVSVLLNAGNGSFGSPTQFITTGLTGPEQLTVGDFDGDRHPDAIASTFNSNVAYLKGNGNGTFAAATLIKLDDMNPYEALRSVDIDGDGALDLVTLGFDFSSGVFGNGLRVFLGNADGTFKPGLPAGAVDSGSTLTLAHVDSGDTLDAIVTNGSANSFSVFFGKGNGRFELRLDNPIGRACGGNTVVFDADGDGIQDIGLGGTFNTGDNPAIIQGIGGGFFGPATTITSAPTVISLVAQDVDNDDIDDLIGITDGFPTAVTVMRGRGDGQFDTFKKVNTPGTPTQVALGDVSGDGKPDAISLDTSAGKANVQVGVGDGTFGAPTQTAAGTAPTGLLVLDVNADTKMDLVFVDVTAGKLIIRKGNGNGTFQADVLVSVGSHPEAVAAADFNVDGRMDFVTANENSNSVTVVLQQVGGGFTPQPALAAGNDPASIAVGDTNNDGKLDIVTGAGGHTTSNAVVFLGNGNGTFGAPSTRPGISHGGVAVADVTGDGLKDIVIMNGDSGKVLLGGGGEIAFPAFETFSEPGPVVAVADIDGDGHADIVSAEQFSHAVAVRISDGAGGFLTPRTFDVGDQPGGMAIADINNDGKPDLVTAHSGASALNVSLHR